MEHLGLFLRKSSNLGVRNDIFCHPSVRSTGFPRPQVSLHLDKKPSDGPTPGDGPDGSDVSNTGVSLLGCTRKLGSMVSKWVISPTYKWGILGYITNHLLSSWDIQVCLYASGTYPTGIRNPSTN